MGYTYPGGSMAFSVGLINKVANKRGIFLDYDIMGYQVVDATNQRGWILEIIDGLESGSFSVTDGRIHRCRIEPRGGNEPAILDMEIQEATFRWPSAKQAISDALAVWEGEEQEKLPAP